MTAGERARGAGTAAGVPGRIVFVVGTTTGGTGTHVRMLAAGCAARGSTVTVAGPSRSNAAIGFAALPGVRFTPAEFGDRPRVTDIAAVLRLRAVFRTAAGPADVVHAHGLRAAALSVLARAGLRRAARPALVVTVHNAPPPGGGAAALVYRLLELIAARGADQVLCVSGDLEPRMRAAGARRVARALVPAPAAAAGRPVTPATGRPVVLAAGRLAPQKGLEALLDAAASWRDLDPAPRLVIAGDGPLAASLRARAAARGVDAEFLGHRDDVPALLAAAAVFVLPSRWEGQPLALQEALRAGAPVVATRVGGIPELTGEDAAVLVPPGDAVALGGAVRAVLTDAALAARLRAAARAVALPTETGAVDAVLAGYAALTRPRARPLPGRAADLPPLPVTRDAGHPGRQDPGHQDPGRRVR